MAFALSCGAQTVTATLGGQVTDPSGGVLSKVTVTAVNRATGFVRTTETSDTGEYLLLALPVGEYRVSVEATGFRREKETITLEIGQVASLDFTLRLGEVTQSMVVEATSEVTEPTRTQVSTVITENQIETLPVNGRQFIDFALLAPGVQIGDTTSGNTDVIIEPVTKLSFAGQNIHFNFIAVDGADNVSTASAIQRATPPQEAVREFRVINTNYTADYGRAIGGIVNIITRSGTNDWHGSVYEYFRNNVLDATSILQAPGLSILRQNQFGASLGGPIERDKTFVFANYEGQRRGESPFYNSAILSNIGPIDGSQPGTINFVKVKVFNLPPDNLNVLRTSDIDNGFIRLDHNFGSRHYFFTRYFITDARLTHQSPLNGGFDMPSAYKDNFFRDQSFVGELTSTFSARTVNELRLQFARRTFAYPSDSTQPGLEVTNTFFTGRTRSGPEFYREHRFELVDNFTINRDRHTISLGGNFNFVRTRESFPAFYPFVAQFASIGAFVGNDRMVCHTCPASQAFPHPSGIFFARFRAPSFDEKTIDPSIYQGERIPQAIRDQAQGTLDHTYDGLFIQDKWRATSRLTFNGGFRWEFETWPSAALKNRLKNFDPRAGLAYSVDTKRNVVVRAGFGLFHGIIPAPALMCQRASCGGVHGKFPGRNNENDLNATNELFVFAAAPDIMNQALTNLLNGHYPDDPNAPRPATCKKMALSDCGFFGQAVVVRFAKNHQNPYGVQASLGIEFQPLRDTAASITFLHVKGVHLGSIFNVNQPPPSTQVLVHTSGGASGCKNVYFKNANVLPPDPSGHCPSIYPPPPSAGGPPLIPGISPLNFTTPVNPPYGIYLEGDSRWNSVFDGLLLNVNKRLSHHFTYGISYTFSKTIDDGPNPTFALLPQDSGNIRVERAISADDLRHRLVGNAMLASPSTWNPLARDFQFSLILTLQSPQHFTKYAGFDANGDLFAANDRVGLEPRNTFQGDSLRTVDLRMARTFSVGERRKLALMAEAFNLLNTVNIQFFNTAYGAADFCPVAGPNVCGHGPFFKEGSPNRLYATPRAVFNPRQLQLALRFTF